VGDERQAAAQITRCAPTRRRDGLHWRAELQVGVSYQRPGGAQHGPRAGAGIPLLHLSGRYPVPSNASAQVDIIYFSQIGKQNTKYSNGFSIQQMPVSYVPSVFFEKKSQCDNQY
jgi:hypothetical protein